MQEHAVDPNGGLHHKGDIRFFQLRIIVLNFLSGKLLVLRQIEVGARVNPLHFLETKGELVFHINGGIGVVRQLFVFVKAVVLLAKTKGLVPLHAGFLPLVEPLQLRAGANKKLHFHLLELAHAENKLAGNNLIPECFPDLSDAKRNFHATSFLHIQVVDENSLGRFRAKVNFQRPIGC